MMTLRLFLLLALLSASCGSRTDPPPVRVDGGGGGEDVSDLIKPGTPAGTCLLDYNTALGGACCWAMGGVNQCNTRLQCGAAGAGCCTIYRTNATVDGMGCCYYPDPNKHPSSEANCKRLLAAGR